MRCLYCGKRLSVFRKLGGSEFCSEAHRRRYLNEQETLGLARLIESKSTPKPKSRPKSVAPRTRGGGREAPAFFDNFLPQPLLARSVIVPYQKPGPPIVPEVALAAPQQEVHLGFCRLPRAAIEAPSFLRESSAASVQRVQAEMMASSVPVSIPCAESTLRTQFDTQVPDRARAVPVVLEIPAGEPGFADTEAMMAMPPERLLAVPTVRAGARTNGLPISKHAVPFEQCVTAGWQVSAPSSILTAPAGTVLPDSNGEGPRQVDLQDLLAAYEKNYRGGFLTLLRTVAPEDDRRVIRAEQIPPGNTDCAMPRVAAEWVTELEKAGQVNLEYAYSDSPPHAITPSDTHFLLVPRMPNTAPRVSSLEPRRAGSRPVPLAFRDGGFHPRQVVPDTAPWSAFLLPPPDVSLPPLSPARSSETAHVPLTAVLAEDEAPVSGGITSPVAPTARDPQMPGAVAARLSAGLGRTRDPARASHEPWTPSSASHSNTEPVTLRAGGPHLPLPESGSNPAALEGATAPAETGHPEQPWAAEAADGPSYQALDSIDTNEVAVIPQAPDRGGEAETSGLQAAAKGRPQLLPIGLGALVPKDAANYHRASEAIRSMAPEPMIPTTGLRTIGELDTESDDDIDSGVPLWRKAWAPLAARSRLIRKGAIWTSLAACLILVFQAYRPSASTIASDVEQELENGFRTELAGHWASFQADIASRAAINLMDDFRSGLGNWTGDEGWSKSWSYDDAGFAMPGDLALFRPTIPLADYRVNFSGQIEERGLSWTVRAADPANYYLIRLAITEPGPIPHASIIRYAVVDGHREEVTTTPLPFPIRNGQMHEIGTVVNGGDFTLYVNGRLVDFWSEPRLRTGGVGFLRSSGEVSRLRWVSVTHQHDLLGRLCALLVPYNFEHASRSIER